MDFFLDSGVFLGLCDHKDDWHTESKSLLERHPRQTNNYYSAKKVKDELKMNRLQIIKKGYDNEALSWIYKCIKRRLRQMKKLIEYENKKHVQFNPLFGDIEKITDYAKNDAIIVTNAIFWSCKCTPSGEPTLISTDKKHILSKAERIIEKAESKCNRSIPLKIISLEDI